MPCAPSDSAATRPRPSANPPAANTGTGPTASTTIGMRGMLPIQPTCPPPSLPWAMMISAPAFVPRPPSALHVGDFAARLGSPVKIWGELLVGSRPSELHDRRTQLECRGETVLARVKQQEVQTERLIGILAGCRRALT